MKKALKTGKILKCNPPNTQCGGLCLVPYKTCSDQGPKTTQAIDQLFKTKPKQLLKAAIAKGFGPIQYITQQEALRAYGVYGGGDIFQMKSGAISHPYIKINKIEQAVVDKYHDKLKADKIAAMSAAKAAGKKAPFTLYDRLTKAGIRDNNPNMGKSPKMSTEDKVKTFLRLYMEQNGQSFATGNRVNLNRLVVDHIIPLGAGGRNTADNMVLIESNINYWKKATPTQKDLAIALERKIQTPTSASLLTSYAKAVSSGNKAESEKLQKQILLVNKINNLRLDRAQAQAYREGAKQKESIASNYDNLRWAKFNTVSSLNSLFTKEVEVLLKVQVKEGVGVRGWYLASSRPGPLEVQKLFIFLNNGGKWKDAPDSWKDTFKKAYSTNVNKTGNKNVQKLYGGLPDAPDWLTSVS